MNKKRILAAVLSVVVIIFLGVLFFGLLSKETEAPVKQMTDEERELEALRNLTAPATTSPFSDEEKKTIDASLTAKGESKLSEEEKEEALKSLTPPQS